jgi:glycosyltransferase involved in cell wall biosynthesis
MSQRMPGAVFVIPALNEAASIADVVTSARTMGAVIVVDDGSTDRTADLAAAAGARVVRHEQNRGYDAALASGIHAAMEAGADYAITLDADGQHDPGLAQEFLRRLQAGADLVVGQRDRHQRISESIFSIAGTLLWNLKDPLCGMKGYRLSRFREAGRFDSYQSIGTAFAIIAARSGYNIEQVPINTRRRIGKPRFGSGLRANLVILRALVWGMMRGWTHRE